MTHFRDRLCLTLWLLIVSVAARAQFADPAIAVSPPEPAPSDQIVVTVSDTNSNGCVPRTATSSRAGNTIDVVEEQPAGGICLTVVTPYSIDVPIGQLPAGDYLLRYFRDGVAASKASTTLAVRERIPGILQFGMPAFSVADDALSVQITVTREGGADGAVSVAYATGTGTALAGTDFVAENGRLSWADQDTGSRTFEVPILEPSVSTRSKTLALILSDPEGGTSLGELARAELTISGFENGPGGVISFVDAAGGIPSGATVSRGEFVDIFVRRYRGTQGPASVRFTTRDGASVAGSDYELPALVGAPLQDSLDIPSGSGMVEEVRLDVALDHGHVGDLVLSLTAPDGTSVVLMDRPGAFGSFLGEERDTEGNSAALSAVFPVSFRDGFGGGRISAEAAGADCGDPGIIGRDCDAEFRPSGPGFGNSLSRFAGKSASGEWKLSVTDFATGVTGTLVDWQLQLETTQGTVIADSLINNPLQVPDGSDTDDPLRWQNGEDGLRVVRVQSAFTSNLPGRFEAVLQDPQGTSLRRGFAELAQFVDITGDAGLGTSGGDLRVTLTMSENPLPVDTDFSLNVNVSNNLGLQNTTRVSLALGAGDAVQILSGDGCTGDAGALLCDIEPLPGGSASTPTTNSRQLQLRSTAAGRLRFVAQVADIPSATGPGSLDDNTSNNLAVLDIDVQDTSPPGTGFQVGPGISGSWFDQSHKGEGFLIEILPGNLAVVYWFTYTGTGEQAWLFGVGTIRGDTIGVADAQITRGPMFGPTFEPKDYQPTSWGSLRFEFSSCMEGKMSYEGPAGFGSGSLALGRLTYIADSECPAAAAGGTGAVRSASSGSYFDPSHRGEGFLIEILSAEQGLVYWFTYDSTGEQYWIVGIGAIDANKLVVAQAFSTAGGIFGPEFDPDLVRDIPWGTLEFTFDDCNNGSMSYQSDVVGFDAGAQKLQRLTTLAGVPCT